MCRQLNLKVRSIRPVTALKEIFSTKSPLSIYRQTSHFNHIAPPVPNICQYKQRIMPLKKNLSTQLPPDKNSREMLNPAMQTCYANKSNTNRQGYKFALRTKVLVVLFCFVFLFHLISLSHF